MEESVYNALLKYAIDKEYQEGLTENEKRKIRRQTKQFVAKYKVDHSQFSSFIGIFNDDWMTCDLPELVIISTSLHIKWEIADGSNKHN